VQLVEDRAFQVDPADAGELQQIQRHVGQLARQRVAVADLAIPLEMLQHLSGLNADRRGEVARRLRVDRVWLVPPFRAHKLVHQTGEVVEGQALVRGCGHQYAFLLRWKIVWKIVRSTILMSSHSDQFSTYHKSYFVRSRIEVSPRSPFTCAQPVMPAFSRCRSI